MKERPAKPKKQPVTIPGVKSASAAQTIFFPRSIKELLTLYNKNPGSIIFAGGTGIMMNRRSERERGGAGGRPVISLKRVQDLTKVVRRERFLEIGAAVPLSRLASIGSRIVPKTLYNAIINYGYYGTRNLATLGGLICSPWDYSEIITILYALDAQLEIRSIAHTGWILISGLKKADGESILSENEILTRVRIPYGSWNRSYSRVFGMDGSSTYPGAIFSGFARIEKESIEDIRLSFGGIGNRVIRERNIEMTLQGKKIPLTEKDLSLIESQITDLLDGFYKPKDIKETGVLATPASINPVESYRASALKRIMLWFLNNLEYPDYLGQIGGLQNRQSKLYF
ncbi:MAG: hypothetical protein DRP57_02170 [Spirochaetes bacterium]|nr:MAG: hypothetical protein DRP57_02170 [Spirochaetota bacterium]